MSDSFEHHTPADGAAKPCDCILCAAARAIADEYEGPKTPPRDDDDDSDDDVAAAPTDADAAPDAERCACKYCVPKPIPEGEALCDALRSYVTGSIDNYDQAGAYGLRLSRHLAAQPMPAEVEAIVLQYCVECWNAADRVTLALLDVVKRTDPKFANEAVPEPQPKTLDEALTTLARMRSGRPRAKGHDRKARLDDAIADALNNLASRLVKGARVEVVKVTL